MAIPYKHLPSDVEECLEDYDVDVESGEIEPWVPGRVVPTEHDEWLADFARVHLPSMDYDYDPDDYR